MRYKITHVTHTSIITVSPFSINEIHDFDVIKSYIRMIITYTY